MVPEHSPPPVARQGGPSDRWHTDVIRDQLAWGAVRRISVGRCLFCSVWSSGEGGGFSLGVGG